MLIISSFKKYPESVKLDFIIFRNMTDRPTDQPTDRPTNKQTYMGVHREVTLQIILSR